MDTRLILTRDKKPTWVYRPARRIVRDYGNGVSEPEVVNGIEFRAKEIGRLSTNPEDPPGIPAPTLATRNKEGRALGMINVQKEAQKWGIEPEEILRFFCVKNQKYYGVEFIVVDGAGNEIPSGEAFKTDAELDKESKSDDPFVQLQHDGRYFCEICNLYLDPRGVHGHIKAKKHTEGISKRESLARAAEMN